MPKGDNLNGKNTHKNDEFYTPRVLIEPIFEFLPKDKIIWCPFDTPQSEFVRYLTEKGYTVEQSHIQEGKDFFEYEPKEWDIIVSNPPFSKKMEVLERLYSFNKPFAILMSVQCLNFHVTGDFFIEKQSDIQFLYVNKRVSFDGNPSSFNTSYFCRKLLPTKVEFRGINNNNANQHYQRSNMEDDRKAIKDYYEGKD